MPPKISGAKAQINIRSLLQRCGSEEEFDATKEFFGFAATVFAGADVFAVEVFDLEADIFQRCPVRADNKTASAAQSVIFGRDE